MLIAALDASDREQGRTALMLRAFMDAAVAYSAASSGTNLRYRAVRLADAENVDAVKLLREADGFVVASPVYRASYTWLLKRVLDHLPRGMYPGEPPAAVGAKPAALLLCGASQHHYLALDDLRSVLAGFFAVHVLTPGVYLDPLDFPREGGLTPAAERLIKDHAACFVDLSAAISTSACLSSVRPQI